MYKTILKNISKRMTFFYLLILSTIIFLLFFLFSLMFGFMWATKVYQPKIFLWVSFSMTVLLFILILVFAYITSKLEMKNIYSYLDNGYLVLPLKSLKDKAFYMYAKKYKLHYIPSFSSQLTTEKYNNLCKTIDVFEFTNYFVMQEDPYVIFKTNLAENPNENIKNFVKISDDEYKLTFEKQNIDYFSFLDGFSKQSRVEFTTNDFIFNLLLKKYVKKNNVKYWNCKINNLLEWQATATKINKFK